MTATAEDKRSLGTASHALSPRLALAGAFAGIALALAVPATAGAVAATAPAAQPWCSATPHAASPAYLARIDQINHSLKIPPDYSSREGLVPEPEAPKLVGAGRDAEGRIVQLDPSAAAALHAMFGAATHDGVTLQVVSAYRSVAYQQHLVRMKLRRGMSIKAALSINTAPGYSEHHSGCAVDLTAPGTAPAEQTFAHTAAYSWLMRRGGEFGFHLSYPQGNQHSIEFEPWHWRYIANDQAQRKPKIGLNHRTGHGG